MADETAQDTGTENTDAGAPQSNDAGNPAASGTENTSPAAGQGADDKSTEAEVEYKFTAPEGVELDAAQVDQFKAIAKELKLPADKAQAVADIAIKAEVARREAFAKTVEGWGATVAADKELGVPENQALARQAIDTFGTPELKALLNSSGLGNHPELVRLAYRVGKAISEDTIKGKVAGEAQPRDTASLLYPSTSKA